MKTLIIGCGYVGAQLGSDLVNQGHQVCGLSRSTERDAELEKHGIQPVHADITNASELSKLPPDFDWVVNCVSSGRGSTPETYKSIYLEGTRNILNWLKPSPPKKLVYTSSTSVYGQHAGECVHEDDETKPRTEFGEILLQTEQELINAFKETKFPAVILRVAGIYGPGRLHYLDTFMSGKAVVYGQQGRHLNMIHRDDVAGAIRCALRDGKAGRIYNACDDEPVTQQHFYQWAANMLLKSPPEHVPASSEPPRKRGTGDKLIVNKRIKMELGYKFRFPNFRQGFDHEMAAID